MQQPKRLFNRNFTLLWLGQSVSELGSQGFTVAMLLWIKEATNSASLIGLLLMVSSLPGIILSPIGGALADRFSRRRIIVLGDLLSGIAVLGLAGLLFFAPTATELIIAGMFVVATLLAIIGAFFGPAIMAAIPDLVPRERLVGANSMMQIASELAIFVGQGIGAVLFRLLGAPVLMLVDGLTYLFAATNESLIQVPQRMPEQAHSWREQFRAFRNDMAEGLRYVRGCAGLRELLLLSAFLTFFGAPIIVLLPFYVEGVLRVPIDWYGYLLASYSAGTVLGYAFAGGVKIPGRVRGVLMILFIVGEATVYASLGLLNLPFLALGLACIAGLMNGYVNVNISTIVQTTTPSDLRGRVFGLLATISAALAPISMGLTGVVADLLGQNIPLIYSACGAIMIVLTLLIALNRAFRSFLVSEPELEEPQETSGPLAKPAEM
jgi:MFS family permease